MEKILFTSEAVSEGHPDKLADQIADAILDECLKQDSNSHVACEVFLSKELVLIGGEITTNAKVDYAKVARKVLKDIGYTKPEIGIGYKTCEILDRVNTQSIEINQAVSKKDFLDTGAGDQGIVFGYATNQTKNYMPIAISIANDLVKLASKLRKEGKFKHARPDMKSQVTYDYKNNRIDTIVMSVQHEENINLNEFKKFIKNKIIDVVVKSYKLNKDFIALINPSGSFTIGGPLGDTGLTGRKLICDTYGGAAHNGGGALSGKDGTKVDRSGQYYARYIAKNLVAAKVCDRIEVQLSFAIGVSKPISISIATFKTCKYSDKKVIDIINKVFDLRVGSMIKQLKMDKPNYKYFDTASYGHFGRDDLNLPWEKLDKVNEIKKLLK